MLRHSHLLVALLTLAPACAGLDDPGSVASSAPALGKADGTDAASHDCEVVLRQVVRNYDGGDWATDCSTGECLYVWQGAIDVAEAAWQDGASVHLLYHRTTDPTWWEVTAEPGIAELPTYRRFEFEISEHLFGPAEADAGVDIELVAYLAMPDGGRLFDHNRFPGDFDNYHLSSDTGYAAYDSGVCVPQVAHVMFDAGYGYSQYNDFRQDGYIAVEYALERLPECRSTHNGYPAWDTVAYARFSPGGQLFEQSARAFETVNGTPTTTAYAVPFFVEIPDDATSVELWFRNYSGAGSSCETWDSNWGANYRFVVRGAPGNPARCDGYELWTPNTSRPVCLGYDVAADYDADHCELYVDGVGHAHEGHYGIPHEWLDVYLHLGPSDGAIENAGMWARYHDDSDQSHEALVLGTEVSPGVYHTGLTLLMTGYMSPGYVNTVDQMAFFVDVRRPSGQVVRLWQSRHGANYSFGDAFDLPTTQQWIAYGTMDWANDEAPIYDSRNACN